MFAVEQTGEYGSIEVYDDPQRFRKVVSAVVENDFDIDAFKAALKGVKSGDYKKSLDTFDKNEILDHLITRTSGK